MASSSSTTTVSQTLFLGLVGEALKQIHGLIGGSIPYELVAYDPGTGTGVLKLKRREHAEKIGSALGWFNSTTSHTAADQQQQQREFRFELIGSSPFLLSLALPLERDGEDEREEEGEEEPGESP